ncbi:MAG: hypothetical protein V4710_12195 [Verrucomicrobiota bacterium]
MARKTVRVEIPSNSPDSMITMARAIKKEHDQAGPRSRLKPERVQAMHERAEQARLKRDQAEALEAEASRLRDESDALIGLAPGQTRETAGTLLHDLTRFRDLLLLTYRGAEQTLGEYGFHVVIGTAALPTRSAASLKQA